MNDANWDEDWVYLCTADSGVDMFGDAGSRGDNRAFVEFRYPQPQRVDGGAVYMSSIFWCEADCAERKIRTLDMFLYDGDDQPVARYTPSPDESEWEEVIPDEGSEYIYRFICERHPR